MSLMLQRLSVQPGVSMEVGSRTPYSTWMYDIHLKKSMSKATFFTSPLKSLLFHLYPLFGDIQEEWLIILT